MVSSDKCHGFAYALENNVHLLMLVIGGARHLFMAEASVLQKHFLGRYNFLALQAVKQFI